MRLYFFIVVIVSLLVSPCICDLVTSDSITLQTLDGRSKDTSFTKQETIVFKSGKEVSSRVQVLPYVDIVANVNQGDKTISFVQYKKGYYEGYYSYGRSSSFPWGIYWRIETKDYLFIYADFQKRSTYVIPIGKEQFEKVFYTPISSGKLPSVIDVQGLIA